MTPVSSARFVVVAALGVAAGCGSPELFTCQSDVQCVTEMVQGQCEAVGVCSFPDLGCDSGLRYGERAGELAGTCVGEGASTESGSGSGSGSGSMVTGATAIGEASGADESGVPPVTTGLPPGDAYGPCLADGDCTEPAGLCVPLARAGGFCSQTCIAGSDECPPDPSGVATAECIGPDGIPEGLCVLSCAETMACPEGMVCVQTEVGVLCTW